MTTDEQVKFIKVQTCTLRVGIHCQACKDQIKTILRKIDGVYKTSIDAEQQTVKVSGIFDSEVLIKKLLDQGRHAELCATSCLPEDHSEQPNFNNETTPNISPHSNNNIKKKKNKKTKKKCQNNNQQNIPNPIPLEHGDEQEPDYTEEDEEEEEHDEEIQPGKQEVVIVDGRKRIHSKGKEGVDQKMKGPLMEGSGSDMNNDEVIKRGNGTNLMEDTSFFVGNLIPNVNGAGSSRGWQYQQQQHIIPATMVHMNANPQTQFMYQMGPGMIPSNTGGYYYYTSSPYSETVPGYYGGAAHYYYYYDNVLMNVSTNQDNASGTWCRIM